MEGSAVNIWHQCTATCQLLLQQADRAALYALDHTVKFLRSLSNRSSAPESPGSLGDGLPLPCKLQQLRLPLSA